MNGGLVKITGFQTLPKFQNQKKDSASFFFLKKPQIPQKVTRSTHSPVHSLFAAKRL